MPSRPLAESLRLSYHTARASAAARPLRASKTRRKGGLAGSCGLQATQGPPSLVEGGPREAHGPQSRTRVLVRGYDTETSILRRVPGAFKDLMIHSSAIRITYRISLRSSSSQEPRYPLPKVFDFCMVGEASSEARPQPGMSRWRGV